MIGDPKYNKKKKKTKLKTWGRKVWKVQSQSPRKPAHAAAHSVRNTVSQCNAQPMGKDANLQWIPSLHKVWNHKTFLLTEWTKRMTTVLLYEEFFRGATNNIIWEVDMLSAWKQWGIYWSGTLVHNQTFSTKQKAHTKVSGWKSRTLAVMDLCTPISKLSIWTTKLERNKMYYSAFWKEHPFLY